MHLEKHAKALLDFPQSSDDDNDYPSYRIKAMKYRKDGQEADLIIEKLKKENKDNKQMITQLLEDLEIHRKRIKLLEQELLNQKQLSQDSIEQLRRAKQQKQEDRLIKEQKQFQEKMTITTNDAIEKLKQHFDNTLKQLTPQSNKQ